MRLHGQNQIQKMKNWNNFGKAWRNWKKQCFKITNIQNDKPDKLANITQNLKNKLNGIQQKMVEYENKLNQLEEEKSNYATRWFSKQICLSFNLTDKNNT